MRRILLRLGLVLPAAAVLACADTARDPVSPTPAPPAPRLVMTAEAQAIIDDLASEFGGTFSWDTTQTGMNSTIRYDAYAGEDGEFCRDHFNAIDLWWDGGYGIAVIHLDPPLLFRGYRAGTFKDRRNLFWRRAIYETLQPGEGEDPAGNLWRFQGRFNALCRGGSREIGPIVFNSQLLVAQDPIDRPVLVRRGSGGGGGCGDSREELYEADYSVYEDGSRPATEGGCAGGGGSGEGSGTQYQPGQSTGGETVDWGTGVGNGGSSVCGDKAVVEYICIDVYNERSGQWETWSCGYATTC